MGKHLLFFCVVLSTIYLSEQCQAFNSDISFEYISQNLAIKVNKTNQKTVYTVEKFGRIVHRIHLDDDFGKQLSKTNTRNGFVLHGSNRDIEFRMIEDSEEFGLVEVSTYLKPNQVEKHCIDLQTGHLNWFGGPKIHDQYWPIEKLRFDDYSYVTKQTDDLSIAERYWLNSKGGFIYVDDKVPLFIDQNLNGNYVCFKSKNALPYNTRRTSIDLVYHLGAGQNAKLAQREAVKHFLNKPTDIPDRRMVEHPIWSTWAKYKRDVNESAVETFVSEIEKYGFKNSQFEIDDDWEICYGALTFRDSKFPNIKQQTDDLKARGFRVTLWIHPFINKGCEPWYSEAKENG